MASACFICDTQFPPKSSRGLIRYTLRSLCSSPYTARKIFPSYTIPFNQAYVCAGCAKTVRAKTLPQGRTAKRRWGGPRTPSGLLDKDLYRVDDPDIRTTPPPKRQDTRLTPKSTTLSSSTTTSFYAPVFHSTPMDTFPAQESPTICEPDENESSEYSFRTPVINYILRGHYYKAFMSLVKESAAAKRDLRKIAINIARQEITSVTKKKSKGSS